MAIKIRPIVLEDAASYRRCFNAVAKERRYFLVDKASPLSVLRARLRKNLRKKMPFVVAVEDERVVGWAAVFRAGVPALSHNGDLVMGLLPEYRGIGLGTKLVAGVLKKARGEFDSVIFCFLGKNKPARKLSKKMGFELCGREKKFAKMAYGFDDQLITQKQLRR